MNIIYIAGGIVALGLVCLSGHRTVETGGILMTAERFTSDRLVSGRARRCWPSRWARTWRACTKGNPRSLDRVLGPVERFLYRLFGIRADQEMDWKTYTDRGVVVQRDRGCVAVCLAAAAGHAAAEPARVWRGRRRTLSFNTAISFTTNTNWQGYSGEVT